MTANQFTGIMAMLLVVACESTSDAIVVSLVVTLCLACVVVDRLERRAARLRKEPRDGTRQ